MSVNKVILVGRLGRDPETRYTGGGQAVANFSMATDESYKDKNGERQKRTAGVAAQQHVPAATTWKATPRPPTILTEVAPLPAAARRFPTKIFRSEVWFFIVSSFAFPR